MRVALAADDLTGPTIESVTISSHEAGPGEEVTVTVTASDESGVSGAWVFFEGPNGASVNEPFEKVGEGVFRCSLIVTDAWRAGRYVAYHVYVKDAYGNGTSYDSESKTDPLYGDVYFDVVGIPAFRTHSLLLLSGQIGVKFYMDLSPLSDADLEACSMTFKVCGREITDPFDASDTNKAGTYHGFTCPIRSVEMADEIVATLAWGDGQTVSQTYSAAEYVETFEANAASFDEDTQSLIRSIADYGHYVQPFLATARGWEVGVDHAAMAARTEYGQDELSGAAEATAPYAIVRDIPGDSAVTKVNYSLDLEDTISVYLYYTVADGASVESATLADGTALSPELRPDGRWRVAVRDIPAHRLGQTYVVTAKVSDGSEVATIVSALSYVQGTLAASTDDVARNAVTSIYRYWAANLAYRDSHAS